MTTPVGYADCSIFYKHLLDDEEYALTFGVETDLGTFDADAHAAHVSAATAFNLRPGMSDDIEWTRGVLRFGQDGGDDLVAEFDLTGAVGVKTGSFLPQNCALLFQKRTNLGGRRNRGRGYLAYALQESQVDDVGGVLPATVTEWQGYLDDWFDALTVTNGGIEPSTPMVILHGPGVSGGAVPAPTLVTSLTCDALLATQRRRLRR